MPAMRIFFFLVFSCFYLPVFSQTPVEEEEQVIVCFGEMPPVNDSIFEIFDLQKPAVFPGGQQHLLQFLMENIYWPKGCEDRYGTIAVRFVIDTLGECRDWEILKTPGKCFEPLVADIFAKMPCWEPGEYAGRRVRTRYVLPIRIRWE
jgi:protein TonB